jgi:hypothetical protein
LIKTASPRQRTARVASLARRTVDLFRVGGEPDDPAVDQEEKGLMRRQVRTNRPWNKRLSGSNSIGGQPLRSNYHGQIVSGLDAIGKSCFVKTVTQVCVE